MRWVRETVLAFFIQRTLRHFPNIVHCGPSPGNVGMALSLQWSNLLSVLWWIRASEFIVPRCICCPILYIFHFWANTILVSENREECKLSKAQTFELTPIFYSSFYDNAIHCEWKIGSILSISAAAMYYICSILLCCMPRPNPCIGNGNDGDNRNNAGDVEKAAGTEDERHSDSDHTTEH